jgi:hypothetical protein
MWEGNYAPIFHIKNTVNFSTHINRKDKITHFSSAKTRKDGISECLRQETLKDYQFLIILLLQLHDFREGIFQYFKI